MKKEQIEKAAWKYAESTPQSDERKEYSREDFVAGAQWRINSLWHDEKVMPDRNLDKVLGCGEDVILKPKYRQIFEICEVCWDEDEQKFYLSGERETFFIEDVEIWAYVDDLLPERKEETNGGR